MILHCIFYNFIVGLAGFARVACRHSNNVSVNPKWTITDSRRSLPTSFRETPWQLRGVSECSVMCSGV